MMSNSYITTSWDDGHPLDLRVADLLSKHGLRGTFYVPQSAERRTMSGQQIRDLSQSFEIGAHTLGHVVLTEVTAERARREIVDSKQWIEDVVGAPCSMFCPPKGRYGHRHARMVRQAGYLGMRSTELVSLDFPRLRDGLFLMPTTVQAFPGRRVLDFVRNGVKRAAFDNLWRFVVYGRAVEWSALSRSLLRRVLVCGGVFHLWGHSWEIADADQWRRLDAVFGLMAEVGGGASALVNGQVCQRVAMRSDEAFSHYPQPTDAVEKGFSRRTSSNIDSRSRLHAQS